MEILYKTEYHKTQEWIWGVFITRKMKIPQETTENTINDNILNDDTPIQSSTRENNRRGTHWRVCKLFSKTKSLPGIQIWSRFSVSYYLCPTQKRNFKNIKITINVNHDINPLLCLDWSQHLASQDTKRITNLIYLVSTERWWYTFL